MKTTFLLQAFGSESQLSVVAVENGKNGLEEDVTVDGEAKTLVALDATKAGYGGKRSVSHGCAPQMFGSLGNNSLLPESSVGAKLTKEPGTTAW